jgi:thiol-disulfide isomerase/thioredoxin
MVQRTFLARASMVSLVALTLTMSMCLGTGLSKGDPAPDFTVTDVDGISHQLDDFEGRVLVVEFFATWCTYCIDQIPAMEKVRQENPEDRVAIMMVDADDRESKDKVAEFRVKYDLTWPVVHEGGDMASDYMVDAYPTTVIVDRDGVVQYFHAGTVSERKLLDVVEDLV